MKLWLVRHINWLENTAWMRAGKNSLSRLEPLIVLAAFTQAIDLACFTPNGFFAEIFGMQHWFPGAHVVHIFLAIASSMLWGVLGALVIGMIVARLTHGPRQLLATGTAVMTLMAATVTTTGTGAMTRPVWPHLGVESLLAALVLGGLIAWLFNHWPHRLRHLLPGLSVALGAGALALGLGRHQLMLTLSGATAGNAPGPLASTNLFWLIMIPLVSSLMWWLGMPGRLALVSSFNSGIAATANLNYALVHNSLAHVPHPFTLLSTYAPFGGMGGTGMLLAFVIALWWRQKKMPVSMFLTTLFNFPTPTLLTAPIIWNVRLLIPFILAPLSGQLISMAAIALHIMPPVVYFVPLLTPGPLVAFLGTNGNWAALIVSLVTLFVGVLIYLPFVDWDIRQKELMIDVD